VRRGRLRRPWRWAAAGGALVVALAVAVTAAAVSSSGRTPLTDATPCSAWAGASAAQRAAYARLYLSERDALIGGSREAARVQSAITTNCSRAAYLGEADEVTVIAAIERHF
jgi:hypothetical protein